MRFSRVLRQSVFSFYFFLKAVQTFQICKTVPNFHNIADWPTSSQMPRKPFTSTCHYSIGQDTRLAAYKRPFTVQFQGGPFITRQVTNRNKNSLSIQLDQTHKSRRKFKNIQTLTVFPEPKFNKINGVFCVALRDSIESSSLSRSPLQFKRESTAKSSEFKRDRRMRN